METLRPEHCARAHLACMGWSGGGGVAWKGGEKGRHGMAKRAHIINGTQIFAMAMAMAVALL
eukprot:581686-Pelagomonas_calceolata.AAC.1